MTELPPPIPVQVMLPLTRPPAMTMSFLHCLLALPKKSLPGWAAFSGVRQWRLVIFWLFIWAATSGGRFGGRPVIADSVTVSHWPGLSVTPPGAGAAPGVGAADAVSLAAALADGAAALPPALLSLRPGVGLPQAASAAARASPIINSVLR